MATGDSIGSLYLAKPATTNGAVKAVTAGPFPVWDFDDATSETLYFYGRVGTYNGSAALRVILPWKFTTFVGSQTCQWEVSFGRVANDLDSIDSVVFAAAQTVLATEASATGELKYTSVAFTNAQADGIQKGELFVLRVVRNAALGTASPGDSRLAVPSVELS